MKIAAITAAAVTIMMLSGTSADTKEQDRTGTFVSGCLPTVNCGATITKVGKGRWKLEWSAENRTSTKTYCRHDVNLKVGVGHSASEPRIPDVLVGKLKDGTFVMVSSDASDGRAFLYADGMPCPGVKLPAGERGTIGFNGLYDLQGDL